MGCIFSNEPIDVQIIISSEKDVVFAGSSLGKAVRKDANPSDRLLNIVVKTLDNSRTYDAGCDRIKLLFIMVSMSDRMCRARRFGA